MAAQICFLEIQGTVNDIHDEGPVPEVSIYLSEIGIEQWTGCLEEIFPLLIHSLGSYHMVIQHIGCPTKRISFDLNADTLIEINIENMQILYEVDVCMNTYYNSMNEHVLDIGIIDNNTQNHLQPQ